MDNRFEQRPAQVETAATETGEVDSGELKREKKRKYDKARKEKIKFLNKLKGDIPSLFDEKTWIAENKPGQKLIVPPIEDPRELNRFFLKQLFDNFAQPILDYESLRKEIEETSPSNTKKKAALRELEEQRMAPEVQLAELPDWNSGASDEEKKEYVARLEKLLKHA